VAAQLSLHEVEERARGPGVAGLEPERACTSAPWWSRESGWSAAWRFNPLIPGGIGGTERSIFTTVPQACRP
jgi:hypothetical protein